MDSNAYNNQLDVLNDKIRQRNILIAGMLVVLVLQSFSVFRLIGSQRETLVTPNLHGKVWVSGQEVSDEYLEFVGKFVADLALNVTPQNISYNQSAFLWMTRQDKIASLKKHFAERAEAVKRDSIRTTFTPAAAKPDAAGLRIAFNGNTVPYVGERRMEERQEIWVIKFVRNNASGRLEIDDLYKTDNWNNPFTRPTDAQ